jgi:hypothetical protein
VQDSCLACAYLLGKHASTDDDGSPPPPRAGMAGSWRARNSALLQCGRSRDVTAVRLS